jgi:hypothetical protein
MVWPQFYNIFLLLEIVNFDQILEKTARNVNNNSEIVKM